MGFCEFDQLDFEGTLIKYILFFIFQNKPTKAISVSQYLF